MCTLPRSTQHPGSTQLGPRRTLGCTNQIKQMCCLIAYMKHVFAAYNSDIDPRADPFHPFTPDEWS